MTWIRGPAWDLTWILSAPVLGAAALVMPWQVLLPGFLILNMAHVIAPVAVAWGHREFRAVAIERWRWFVLIPALVLAGAGTAGVASGKTWAVNPVTLGINWDFADDWLRPLAWLAAVYFAWNCYHFGAQNFGLASLYNRGWRVRRTLGKVAIVAATILGMELSRLLILGFWLTGHVGPNGMVGIPKSWHVPALAVFMFGCFSINHSMASLGLCSCVLARRWRLSPWAVAFGGIVAGGVVFWLMFGAPWAPVVTMTAVGLRFGVGFVHFLYDRWIWRFSDPQVRATLGRELFAAA